jgi:hypothetical protein
MLPVARVLAVWVAATLVTVSTIARAQAVEPPAELPAPRLLTAAESSQQRQLMLRLDDINDERAGTGTVVPWTVIAVGVAAMVVGVSVGIQRVASCEQESCSSPFWPGWLVVGGAGVATGGLLWLKLVREDIAELESRRYHLEQQIDAYEVLREARAQRALLHVRATF